MFQRVRHRRVFDSNIRVQMENVYILYIPSISPNLGTKLCARLDRYLQLWNMARSATTYETSFQRTDTFCQSKYMSHQCNILWRFIKAYQCPPSTSYHFFQNMTIPRSTILAVANNKINMSRVWPYSVDHLHHQTWTIWPICILFPLLNRFALFSFVVPCMISWQKLYLEDGNRRIFYYNLDVFTVYLSISISISLSMISCLHLFFLLHHCYHSLFCVLFHILYTEEKEIPAGPIAYVSLHGWAMF